MLKTNPLKKHRKLLIAIAVAVAVFVLAIIAAAIYVNDYYRADMNSIAAFEPMKDAELRTEDGLLIFEPENANAGFIFYPGGKVEYTAYQPLLAACAEKGILCVLVEMPFNLAVLDINAADGIQEMFPKIDTWYIGGHSLGGSMAASYISDNTEDYDGLILLGSYSTADLSGTELDVLSVFGSEDEVLNREKYNENIPNLPEDFSEFVIKGGCHAYFGMYGEQEGDGVPTITNEEQIFYTADLISDFIGG